MTATTASDEHMMGIVILGLCDFEFRQNKVILLFNPYVCAPSECMISTWLFFFLPDKGKKLIILSIIKRLEGV